MYHISCFQLKKQLSLKNTKSELLTGSSIKHDDLFRDTAVQRKDRLYITTHLKIISLHEPPDLRLNIISRISNYYDCELLDDLKMTHHLWATIVLTFAPQVARIIQSLTTQSLSRLNIINWNIFWFLVAKMKILISLVYQMSWKIVDNLL